MQRLKGESVDILNKYIPRVLAKTVHDMLSEEIESPAMVKEVHDA